MEVPTKELKFIHITKTAGSSIETVGLEKNKRWGIHHKEYGFWHALFPNKPDLIKQKYDWFMVVRNPYKRVLSEYHFLAKALGHTNNKIQFNTFIKKWIINASNNKENHPNYGRVGGDHFTEQYKYLDSTVKIHILKFENITEEFNNLMKIYNYDIILNKKVQVSKPIFNTTDISQENLELIQKIYKKDFEYFGYSTDINESLIVNDIQLPEKYETIVYKPILKYIPISRIANNYISQVAKQLNLSWGENHKEYGWRFEKFINKPEELKSKYEWFMVVRDPYTRILSEYMFIKTSMFLKINHNVDDFNKVINKWITNIENDKQNHPQFGKQIGDHFTEQYNYYDEHAKIHIVKYENIQEELSTLLEQYDYNNITIPYQIENNFPYSIDDISDANIKLINRVYKKDFELFGYQMKDTENTESVESVDLEEEINTQKQLKFIHITRTGGTSIEQVGLDDKKFWGRYDRSYGLFDEPFTLKSESIKNNYEWFTVVRNPYTKILSEYNYLKVVLRLRNCDDLKTFNNYIESWLTTIKNNPKTQIYGYHLIPQSRYIDPKYKITILKFENLLEEFNELMNKYNYSIKLNKIVGSSNSKFTVSDLSEKNILLIKEVYKNDFEQFNYSINSII